MNLAGLSPIHHSNVKFEQSYYYRNSFGEGTVKVLESNLDGWKVEVEDGGFRTHKKFYRPGDEMLVEGDSGKWYEFKT